MCVFVKYVMCVCRDLNFLFIDFKSNSASTQTD